jgi:hypothetical protein
MGVDKHKTAESFKAHLSDLDVDIERVAPTLNKWLARGDGVAVYENRDLSSAKLGHVQICSYGSTSAQIEQDEPPATMPDIGGQINWAYQLVATYKGEAIK